MELKFSIGFIFRKSAIKNGLKFYNFYVEKALDEIEIKKLCCTILEFGKSFISILIQSVILYRDDA